METYAVGEGTMQTGSIGIEFHSSIVREPNVPLFIEFLPGYYTLFFDQEHHHDTPDLTGITVVSLFEE